MAWQAAPIAAVALLLLGLREPARTGVARKAPPLAAAWPLFLRFQNVIAPVLAGIVLIEVGLGGALVWTAPVLQRTFGMSPNAVGGIVATALLLGGILGPVAGGFIADLCQRTGGPRRTMTAISALTALAAVAAAYPLVPQSAVPILLVLFITLIFAIVVMGVTLFTLVVPSEIRGFCQAVLAGACVVAGAGVAPLAVSVLSGALGGPAKLSDALALICVVTSMAAALIFLLFRKAYAKAGEALP